MKRKRNIGIIMMIIGTIALMPFIYIQYQKNNYTVEMFHDPLEIEYDFTKPGITLEEVQELNGNQAEIEYLENGKTVYSIDGVISSQKICSVEDALSVLYDYREVLGIREYEYAAVIEEKEDRISYTFRQLKHGVRVSGYSFTITTTKQGDGIRIMGKYLQVFDFDPASILSYKECVEINKNYFKGSQIKEAQLLICKFDNYTELCWRYEVFSKGPSPHVSVSVSAFTGEIVWISGEAIS